VKDWRRNFWSAVLQHRFRFGWRDDFHVGQSLVQAGPRWAVGLDDASPSNAGFAVPSGLLFCGANLAATRPPHPHLRCGFCFVKTRSLVGRAVLCPPDAESTGCFSRTNRLLARSRARKSAEKHDSNLGNRVRPNQPRRAVDCAPYQRSAPLGRYWSAAILAAVPSRWVERVRAFYNPEGRAP